MQAFRRLFTEAGVQKLLISNPTTKHTTAIQQVEREICMIIFFISYRFQTLI
jgi:hypothetical protein